MKVRVVFAMVCVLLAGRMISGQPAGKSGPKTPGDPNAPKVQVSIKVLVPTEDAQVWIDNTATKAKGTERIFVSPALEPGTYVYTIKAAWDDMGTRITVEQTIRFQPDKDLLVDFKTQGISPQQPTRPKELKELKAPK